MSSNTNIGNTPVNQGYVQLIHTGETGGIDGTLRTLYDGDGTAADLLIASDKVKVSTELFIGAKTLTEFIQDTVGTMFTTGNSLTNVSVTYDDANNNIDLNATGEVTLTGSQTLTNKTLTSPVINTSVSGTAILDEDNMSSNSDSKLATQQSIKAYVDAEVSSLVSSAPTALDTLDELAAALGDDANFATTTATSLGEKLVKASNLSDLTNTTTARSNLGLGSLATANNISVSNFNDAALQTSSESFADNDTSLMTSAAIQDKIESFGFTTNTGDMTGVSITASNPLDISQSNTTSGSYSATISLVASEFGGYLADMTESVVPDNDELAVLDNGTLKRKQIDEIRLTAFDATGFSSGISFDGSTANGVLTFKDSDEATVESNLTFDGTDLQVGSANADTIIKVAGNRAMFGYDNGNFAIVQGGNTKGIKFNTNTDTFAGSPKMTITTAGDVGIGTESPSSPLHISKETSTSASSTGTTLFTLTNDVGSDLNQQKTFVDFTLLDSNANETPQVRIGAEVGHNGDANTQQKEGSGAFVVYTNNADTTSGDAGASLAERMRVDYQGNVGIGSSSPSTNTLQFGSAGDTIGVDLSSGGTTRIAEIELYNSSDGSLRLKTDNASTGGIEFHTEGTKRMEVERGGAVNVSGDFEISATNKLYLDGGSNTYITESSADRVKIFVGGDEMLNLIEGSTNVVRVEDGTYLGVGNSTDLFMYHSSGNSFINNGTGNLTIRNQTDDGDIILQTDDGSGGYTAYLTLDGSEKFVRVPDDSIRLTIGAGNDLQLLHNGSNSFIANYVGDLTFENHEADKDIIFQTDDGSGGLTPYLTLDGSEETINISKNMDFGDNVRARLGAGDDLQLGHDGNDSFISNYTGDYFINQFADDKDIILRCDDGGGGITPYITLDGSDTSIQVAKNMEFADSVQANFGNRSGGDMQIYHDGSNNYINASEGNLILEQNENDHDIILKSDNGSGGTTAYLTLDGSAESIEISKKMQFPASHSADKIVMYSGGNEKIGTEANTLLFTADNYKFKDTNGDVNLFMNNSGNVGIGTTTPSGKLHVSGDAYFTGGDVGVNTTSPRLPLHVASTDGDDDPASASATGAFFVTNSAASYGLHMGVSSDGSGWIQSQSVTSANEYNLNLNPIGGNVGIGTSSPQKHLDITKTGTATFMMKGTGTDNYAGAQLSLFAGTTSDVFNSVMFAMDRRTDGVGGIYLQRRDSSHAFKGTLFQYLDVSGWTFSTASSTTATSTNERMIIDPSGDVKINESLGIGVSASGTTGRLDCSNDVVAFASSDKRLKENIKPLDNALDKINKINGVEFDWKKLTEKEKETIHGNTGHDVGVIAQEIEEVLPEVVQTRDNGYKAVKYEKIVPLLIEAIKELKQEIEELK